MIIINAEIREHTKKKSNKKLRNKNKIPAIIYGKKIYPINIIINYNEINFMKEYKNILNLIYININENVFKSKIQDIQNHPFKKKIIHIDFLLI